MTVGERGSFHDIQGCLPVASKGGFHPIVAHWADISSKRRKNIVQTFAHLLPAVRRLKKGRKKYLFFIFLSYKNVLFCSVWYLQALLPS